MLELGKFKWNTRNYEVSIWTLQDSFIATLKGADPVWDVTDPTVTWPISRQKGRIENAKMTLNMDGTQSLSFDVPMYIREKGVMQENPSWYSRDTGNIYTDPSSDKRENPSWVIVLDGNILVSMRKIKVIFDKHELNYPLLPNDPEKAWDTFKNYVPENYEGNVNLWNRHIIDPETFQEAGYTEFDGDYGTLYTHAEVFNDMMIIYTPVDDDGVVYGPQDVYDYLVNLGVTPEEVYAADKEGHSLVLECFPMSNYRYSRDAIAYANRYGNDLHEMQAKWDVIRYHNRWFGQPEKDPNFTFSRAMQEEEALLRTQNTFEFLITKVTETHTSDNLLCHIECEGLAFHEIGKVGYKRSLSSTVFNDTYNEWKEKEYEAVGTKTAAEVKAEAEPKATLQYWMSDPDQANIPSYDDAIAAGKKINPAQWYFKIRMARTSIDDLNVPPDNHIYEDSFATDWDDNLNPVKYTVAREKCRPVDIEESNIYNISQNLAEKFGVFCKYEYEYDNNYNIIGRCIVFYNNFLSESNEVTTLLYPNSAEEISREMDSVDITSKMFIRDVSDETTYSGTVSITDSTANTSLEDYLLNFDYLHAIGTITDDQYAIIPKFEAGMRKINQNLNPLGETIGYLSDLKVDLEAKEKVLVESIALDGERITESTQLMAQLEVEGKMDAEGYIHITWLNPDTLYLLKDSSNTSTTYDTYCVLLNQGGKVGVDPESVELYKTYRYGSSAKAEVYAVSTTAPVRCYATNGTSFSYAEFEALQFGGSVPTWSETKPETEVGNETTAGKYVWTRKGLDQANGSLTYTYTIQYIRTESGETVNEYITTARYLFYKKINVDPSIPTMDNLDLYHADNEDKWTTFMPTKEENEPIYYISEFRTSSSNRQYGLSNTNSLYQVPVNGELIAQQSAAKANRLSDALSGVKRYDKYGNLEKITGLLQHEKYGNQYYYCIVPNGSPTLDHFEVLQLYLAGEGSDMGIWSTSRKTPTGDCYLWIRNDYKYWNGYIATSYAVLCYEDGILISPKSDSTKDYIKSAIPIFYLKTGDNVTTAPSAPEKHATSKGENAWTSVLPDKPNNRTFNTHYAFYKCWYITYFGGTSEYKDVQAISAGEVNSMASGKSSTSDVPKYIYALYRYKPELYYEKIKGMWVRKLNKDETELEKTRNKIKLVENRIDAYQADYDKRLASKKALIAKFERRMGPALRESYWQPEDEYQNYGTPYHDTLQPSMIKDMILYSDTGEQRAVFMLNNADTYASIGFDGYLFDDETDLYYEYSITQDKRAYPCIDLRKVKAPVGCNETFLEYCKGKIKDHSIAFFFNPNTTTIPAGGIENDIRYMEFYAVGSLAEVGFLWSGAEIIPVMFLPGAESLTDDQLINMRKTGHLGVLKTITTSNSITLGCDTVFEVPDDPEHPEEIAWITFDKMDTQGLVYPRIKVSSTYLKKTSDDITLKYTPTSYSTDDVILEQYEDYYINAKTFYEQLTYDINGVPSYKAYSDVAELIFSEDEDNIERYKNYKTNYMITIKPSWFFEAGLPHVRNKTTGKMELDLSQLKFEFFYKLSNAATEIYLDAKKIMKENAYPKVSYTVKSIPMNTEFSRTLYKQLGQIIMVNDTDLKFLNVFGYISLVDLDLDSFENDNIEVKNYKTKFEDLFSKIVAETEAMQKNSYNIGLAGALGTGGTINSPLGLASFRDTLHGNKDVLLDFLADYFDGPNVVRTQVLKMFNEAGQILSSAYTSLNHVVGLSMDNANVLGDFRENVAAAFTPTVYTGPIAPTTFKAGDIWINSEGDSDYRGVAISGSASGGSFVQTYNGKLAEIDGPAFGMNATTGEIDIINKTNINLSSGHSILIMANDTVEIVGNKSVNLGGTAINIATARTFETINGEKQSTMFGGIHLVATDYDKTTTTVPSVSNNDAPYETVRYDMTLNSTSKMDITGEGIEMATKNGIVIKAGAGIDIKSASLTNLDDGTVKDMVSAIRLDGLTGIYLGSTAPLKFYSGPAVNIFYGPHRGPQFKTGDYWYKVSTYIVKDGVRQDNLDEAGNSLPTIENAYYLKDNKPADYGVWYKATADWTDIYGAEGLDASKAALTDTTGWDTLENIGEALPSIYGANVEISSKAIYLGVQSSLNNATSISLDQEEIILAAGKDLSTIKAQKDNQNNKLHITDIGSAAVSGVEIMSDYIGMATGEGNNRSLLSLKPGFVQIGTMSLKQGAVNPNVPESYEGSYIWMDKGEMYFGSLGHFTINTNNVKIQTKETGDSNTSMTNPTKMGFCLGKNLQADPNSANDIKPMPKLGFWVDTRDEAHLVVDGEITANVLYANGALDALDHGPVFKVDGTVLGIFNLTNQYPYIDSAHLANNGIFYWYNNTLYIKGNLVVDGIQIDGTPWDDYWEHLPISDLGLVQTDLTTMATLMAEIITAAETSVTDVLALAGTNMSILESFYEKVAENMTPDYYEDDSANNYRRSIKKGNSYEPAPYFKQGDVWKHREYDDGSQLYYTNEYTATCNWDDLYWKQKTDGSTAVNDRVGANKTDPNKNAASESALTSLDGWTRTANGRIASITGTGMKVDAASGLFEIWAGKTMNLLCNGTISIAGHDVSITGERTIALAGPDMSFISSYTKATLDAAIAAGKPFIGGIRMTATVTGYTGNDADLNGTSVINMNGQGIEIAAKGGITIKSGRGIDIYFSNGTNAGTSAVRINETEGVWIGSGKAVNLSSNSSSVTGSLFNMTPERILMGVTGVDDSDNSHTTAIDITKQLIVIAASGDLKAIRDNGSGTLVSHDASGNPSLALNVSGVLIRKDYIGMAVNETVNSQQFFSLISLAPREVLIGAGKISGSARHVGSYIKMLTKIEGNDTYAELDIGSTGKFTVLTLTFWIDNSATGTNPMFRLRLIINSNTSKDLFTFSQTNGLVIEGNVTATQFLSATPYDSNLKLAAFKVSSGGMGFYRFDTPSEYPNNWNNASPLMWFNASTGDMYISGRLQVGSVYVGDTLWDTYFTTQHATWMGEVHETLHDIWDHAGAIIAAATSSVQEAAAAALDGENFLSQFRTDLKDKLTPVTFVDKEVGGVRKRSDGTNVVGKFKVGDVWVHTETDAVTGQSATHTYTAISNWSDLYYVAGSHAPDEAAAIDNAGNLKGWSRTSDGRLAAITGAGATFDADSGIYEIKAKNRISILSNGLLELAGQDLSITGEKTLKFAGPSISITSTYTNSLEAGGLGDNAPIRGIRIITTYTDVNNNANSGISKILMSEGITMESRFGIDIASASGIVIRTSATDNADPRASVISLSPDTGVEIGSDKGIYISSTSLSAKKSGTSVEGGIVSITNSRILMGVTLTRKNNTGSTETGSVVDIQKDSILLAYGKNLKTVESTPITEVNDTYLSGVQIKKDYIGMAVSKDVDVEGTSKHYRTLLEMKSDKFFFGVDSHSSDVYDTGSYMQMELKKSGSKIKAYVEIGSTGEFSVLCPTLMINTLNRNTGNTNPMFYVANSGTWNSNTIGIKFSMHGGLEIQASRINLTSSGDLDTVIDNTVTSAVKYFKTTEANTTPTVTNGTDLDNTWTASLKTAAGSSNGFVWSVMKYVHKDNSITYGTVTPEGDLASITSVTYRMYRRTNSTTAPTINNNNRDTNWTMTVPAANFSTRTTNGRTENYITNPYVWSVRVTEKVNGNFVYGTVEEEPGYESNANEHLRAMNVISGFSPVPRVEASGLTIDGDAVTLTSTGTLSVLGNGLVLIGSASSNSYIGMSKDGLVMHSDSNLDVSASKFGIYSKGIAKDDGYTYVMWAGKANPLDTLSGEIWSGYNVVSSKGAPFRVTKDGRVFMDYLMLWDSTHNVYKEVDFSDFNLAVSLTLTVDGNDVRARASFWGKFNSTVARGVTLKLNSVSRNGGNVAYGIVDIDVSVTALVGGVAAKTDTLHGTNVDCTDLVNSGWRLAVGSIKYTSGNKYVTVPTGSTGGAGQYATTQLDISDTYDAGYDDGVDSVTVDTLENAGSFGPAATAIWIRATASNGSSINDTFSIEALREDAYNKGWNACLAACKAVNDAYHAGTSTTWSDSGTKKCSEGHSVTWSTSHTYTPQGSSYSGLYTIPSAK